MWWWWSPPAHPSNLSTPAPAIPSPSPREGTGCSGEPYCLSLAQKLPHLKSLTPPTYLPLPLWHFNKLKVHSILKRETMALDPAFPSSCSEPTSWRRVCAPLSRRLCTQTPNPRLRSRTTSLWTNRVLVWPDSSLVLSPYNPLPPGPPQTWPRGWPLFLCPSPRYSSSLFLTLLSWESSTDFIRLTAHSACPASEIQLPNWTSSDVHGKAACPRLSSSSSSSSSPSHIPFVAQTETYCFPWFLLPLDHLSRALVTWPPKPLRPTNPREHRA